MKYNLIQKLFSLTDLQMLSLYPSVEEFVLKPKDINRTTRIVATHGCFIYEGILKEFFWDHEETPVVNNFYCEKDLLIDLSFFSMGQNKDQLFFQPTEETKILAIPNGVLKQYCEQLESFKEVGKGIARRTIENTAFHLQLLQLKNPVERYNMFLRKRKHLVNRVSVTDLSSYLGVTRETLSRIRHKLVNQ